MIRTETRTLWPGGLEKVERAITTYAIFDTLALETLSCADTAALYQCFVQLNRLILRKNLKLLVSPESS